MILAYTLCVASLGVLFGAVVGSVVQASGIGGPATPIMASLGVLLGFTMLFLALGSRFFRYS